MQRLWSSVSRSVCGCYWTDNLVMSLVPFKPTRSSALTEYVPKRRDVLRPSRTEKWPSGFSFSVYDRDPLFDIMGDFLRGAGRLMNQMDRMMSSMMRDPFGEDPFFGGSLLPALAAPRGSRDLMRRSDPFGFSPFGLGHLMPSMEQMTRDANCQLYSSSSVMTMTSGPDGVPQVYQASSSTRTVPGGVKETRRSVMDSRTGTKKMAIGHHINDRAHIIEKEQNVEGDLEERQEFINLDEGDAPNFDAEFRQRSQTSYGQIGYERRHRSGGSPTRRALPALPASTPEERQRQRERTARSNRKSHKHSA